MAEFDYKEYARQLRENAVFNYMPIEEFTGKILFWAPLPEHPKVSGKEV